MLEDRHIIKRYRFQSSLAETARLLIDVLHRFYVPYRIGPWIAEASIGKAFRELPPL